MRRREYLQATLGGAALFALAPRTVLSAQKSDSLAGEIGLTTGSFTRHLTVEPAAGKLRLLDLPRIMREELDMRVIDLMTATLASIAMRLVGRASRPTPF